MEHVIDSEEIKSLRQELAASQAREHYLRDALFTAAETFAEYAQIHESKNPPDFRAARFNRDRELLCRSPLLEPAAPVPPTDDRIADLDRRITKKG